MIQSRKTVIPDRVGEYAGGVLLLQVQEQLHQGLRVQNGYFNASGRKMLDFDASKTYENLSPQTWEIMTYKM